MASDITNNGAVASSPLGEGGKLRSTTKIQVLHAGAILVVPMFGTVWAISRACEHGLRAWQLILVAFLYFSTMIGITVGFHRLCAHKAFDTGIVQRVTLLILGSMAVQGPPIYWVCNHRRHHKFSDRNGDPHSPHQDGARVLDGAKGFLHAHVRWTFDHSVSSSTIYGRDLLQDPWVGWIQRNYYYWVALSLAFPTLVGALIERSLGGALDGLLWGGAVRLFASYHFVSAINSVTHRYGVRPFETRDQSRNTSWLAVPTLGEGWHNNHHAFPRSALFGHHPWQVDIGGLTILALEKLKLARNVQRPARLP